jgi:hypothetical protein
MIGEFYKNNLQTGLHNNNFFPLQTVVGCIALRKMVVGDKIFLNSEKYEETIRKEYMKYYNQFFNPAKLIS